MVAVEFFGRDRGLSQAVKQQATAAGELDESYKDAARAARRLETDARRTFESTRTPLEQYNRGLARQNELLRSGAIDQETFNRRVSQLEEEYEDAANAQEAAFGSQALTDVTAFVSQLGLTIGVIETVRNALSSFAEERQRAFALTQQGELGLGGLAQVADSAEEFQQLTEAARLTFAEGATRTLDEAGNLIFALQSAGAIEERELFSQLAARAVVRDPAGLARSAQTLRQSLGVDEVGDFADVVSKAFGASQFTPATAEALVEAAARGGGAAAAIGVSDEELLAATAVTSAATGSAERAGTQIASLLRSIDQSGKFRDQTLVETVAEIEAQGLTGEELQQLFGRAEAVSAFRVLSQNIGTFRDAIGEVTEAQTDQRVQNILAFSETDAALNAQRLARAAENTRDIVLEREGIRQAAETIESADLQVATADRGALRFGLRTLGGLFNFIGVDPTGATDATEELLLQNVDSTQSLADELRQERLGRYRERRQGVSTPQ